MDGALRGRGVSKRLAYGLVLAPIVLMGLVVGGWVLGSIGGTVQANNWNHRELLEHLKSHNLSFEMCKASPGSDSGVSMYFVSSKRLEHESLVGSWYDMIFGLGHFANSEQMILVVKCADSKTAHLLAGTYSSSFTWGPWVFVSGPELLAEVKKTLP